MLYRMQYQSIKEEDNNNVTLGPAIFCSIAGLSFYKIMKEYIFLALFLVTGAIHAQEKIKRDKAEDKPNEHDVWIEMPKEPAPTPDYKTNPALPQDPNAVYNMAGLEVMPEYPGGTDAFKDFFKKNIDKSRLYEEIPAKSYKVFISFIIEANGSISNQKVIRDPGYLMGKEVERVLKTNKVKWSPGKMNGKPVRVLHNFPIIIEIP